MRRITFTFLILITAIGVFAQRDTTCWKYAIKYHEQNNYILATPDSWKLVDLTPNSEFQYKFEFTGICLPGQYNSSPITAFATFQEFGGDITLDSILSAEKNKLLLLRDRITESSIADFDTTHIKIATGEEGIMLHTKYYRRVKVQNYSSYFFVVKNEKRNKTYLYHVQFMYKDPTYKLEYNEKFRDYAIRLFSKIKMR